MNRTILSLFRPRLLRMKQFLPSSLFTLVSQVNYGGRPSKSQLNKISHLGEDIGLSQDEVLATLDRPSSPMGIGGGQRRVIFFTMLIAIVVVIWGALYVWAVIDPETAPIKTYTPGTFYGTIRPQDFAIAGP